MTTRPLVPFSGGQDSITWLAWAPAHLRETFPDPGAGRGGCPAREPRTAGGHRWQRPRSR